MRYIGQQHERDPNFPTRVMEMAKHYLQDSIAREQVYEEMKVEVALMKIVCLSVPLPFTNPQMISQLLVEFSLPGGPGRSLQPR